MNKEKSKDCNNENDLSLKKTTRRNFITTAATAVAGIGAAVATIPFLRSWSPDAGVIASGSTEVNIANMKPGDTQTVMWRGQPVFVTYRTEQQIKEAEDVDLASLKDPEPDSERVYPDKKEWLVVIAVCTHLGCVPIVNKGDFDGSLCPCHGSQYDSSGRIRQGPAPTNLVVPPYVFIDNTKIKIG